MTNLQTLHMLLTKIEKEFLNMLPQEQADLLEQLAIVLNK